ncbi:amidohydrolase family protein [Micromonospora sp. NPDC050686]|uniref:amidohydrolase family protein n=1 Tax=Micromonospora sp. NPDC050686 TaxID=3154631 RepID=UPI0033D9B861
MALVIAGRVVPMTCDPTVAADTSASFRGRVWIGDDGMITAVTRSRQPGPAGFDTAPVVDVGTSLVLPGLIDLHNHLAYNTLPLWSEPTQRTPFAHHDSWTRARSYAASVTWPAHAFVTAAPQELLAYAETKAIIGGTTSVQGSPPKNRPRDGWLVRNVEDETWGTRNRNLVYASTLTMTPTALAERANRMRAGSLFIYHCAEGQPGTIAAAEFRDAAAAGCLQPRFVAVHCNAVDPTVFTEWTEQGAVVWSPLSNLWLYGTTTDVPAARNAGVPVCLGSDWAPSGSKHILGELKVARIVADHHGWTLSDRELVTMVTADPGDVLARSWGRQTGRLQPYAAADVTIIRAARNADPFTTVVHATERDVQLVIVNGQPRYGTPALMRRSGAQPVTDLTVAGQRRLLSLTRPDDPTQAWPWQEVLARLEQVRANPKREIERGQARLAAFNGPFDDPAAPLRLALDMPTGIAPVGGLPKDLTQILIPPLDTLTHDDAFLASLVGRGWHGGVLHKLADYYR